MGRGVVASYGSRLVGRDFTHVDPLPSQTGIVVPEEYKAFYAKLSKEYKYFSFSIAEDPADKKKFLCVDSPPCVLRIAHHTTTLFLVTRSFKLHTTYTENLDSKTGDAAMNKAAFDALIKELPAGEPRFLCFYYSLKNAEGRVCDKNLVIKWCVCCGRWPWPPVCCLHPRRSGNVTGAPRLPPGDPSSLRAAPSRRSRVPLETPRRSLGQTRTTTRMPTLKSPSPSESLSKHGCMSGGETRGSGALRCRA